MAEDYTSSFNSYSSVNKALPDNFRGDNSYDQDLFSIYIRNIPKEVNQEAFVQKCAKYGVIKRQKIFEHEITFSGIITYSSQEEAQYALKELHRTPPLHLSVRYANKQKFSHNQLKDINKRDALGASISESQTRPQYIDRGTQCSVVLNSSSQISRSPDQITSPPSGRNFAPNYDDKNPYHLKDGRNSSHVERDGPRNCAQVDRSDSKKCISQPPPLVLFTCIRCYKSGHFYCSHCTTPYCSQDCQKLDWPEHKKMCKTTGKYPTDSDSSTLSAASNANGYSSHNTNFNRKYQPKLKIDLNGKSHSCESEAEDKLMRPACFQFKNSCSRLPNKSPPRPPLGRGGQNVHSLPENKSLGRGNFKSEVEMPSKIFKYGNLKKAQFPESGEKVIVWQVENPRKFWVINKHEKETILNLERDIVQFKSEIQLSLPTKWDLCCVLNKEKKKLGRAVVTEVDGKMKMSRVCFVDDGGAETVSFKDLYLLPDQLMKYPALVVPCTLPNSDIPSNINSDEIKNLFRDITLGNEFKAFHVKGSDELCELSLVNSNGISVSSLLDVQKSSIMLSCLESSFEEKQNSSPETESLSKIPTIYTELKAGSKLVISAALEEDNKVWIQASCPNSTFAEDFVKLDSFFKNLKTEDVSKMLKEGDVAAGFSAKYGNFYRCIILKCLKDKLLVRYIDFGNEEEITRCQKLTPDLLKIQSCVLRCKCSDTFKKDCASAFQKGEFLDAIVNKVMPDYVEISASGSEGKHIIKCCSLYQDIKSRFSEQKSQELISARQTASSVPYSGREPSFTSNLKNCIPTPYSVPGKINAPVPNKTLSPVSSKLVSTVKNMPLQTRQTPVQESVAKNKSLPKRSNGGEVSTDVATPVHTEQLMYRDCEYGSVKNGDHHIIIVHAEMDTVVFMLADEKIIQPLAQLTGSINEFCTRLQCSSYNGQSIVNGQMVLAKYGDEWFRACVIDISPDNSQYEVYFVDFGNTEQNVKLDSLRKMEPQFMNFKIHAHIGELKGYSYTDGTKDAIMKQLQNFKHIAIEAYVEKDPNYQDAGFYCLNIPQITLHLVELNFATVQK